MHQHTLYVSKLISINLSTTPYSLTLKFKHKQRIARSVMKGQTTVKKKLSVWSFLPLIIFVVVFSVCVHLTPSVRQHNINITLPAPQCVQKLCNTSTFPSPREDLSGIQDREIQIIKASSTSFFFKFISSKTSKLTQLFYHEINTY